MSAMSRRSVLAAACGSLASAASVSAWLVRGWVHDTGPAAHGRRIRTSFGSVVLVASRWEAGAVGAGAAQSGTAGAAWTDTIVVLVEVRNESPGTVRVAPGQFRLRIGREGPGMTFISAEPPGGAVAAGRVLHLRLTFQAPPEPSPLGLEYWEVGSEGAQVAALAPAGGPTAHV